jgi:hypothetical protein
METSCGANMFYFPADYHICMIDVYPELEDITFKKHEGYGISQRTIKWVEPSSEWEIINDSFIRPTHYKGTIPYKNAGGFIEPKNQINNGFDTNLNHFSLIASWPDMF